MGQMKNPRELDYHISLIKIVACMCVLLLHICPPDIVWPGSRQLYMIGSFGIPMFFMANGYLLYRKQLTFNYLCKKIIKILKFVVIWLIPVEILLVAVGHRSELLLTVVGVVTGKGRLFHFWFLIALAVVYMLLFLLNTFCLKEKGHSLQECIGWKTMAFIVIMMELQYVLNMAANYCNIGSIRSLVWPSFRIVTNLGYFLLGMLMRKYLNQLLKLKNIRYYAVIGAIASTIYVCFIDNLYQATWASNYYDSIVVIAGCISFFCLTYTFFVFNEKTKKRISKLADLTMPIYVLHPFVIIILNQIIKGENGFAFLMKLVILFAVIVPVVWIIRKLKLDFIFKI